MFRNSSSILFPSAVRGKGYFVEPQITLVSNRERFNNWLSPRKYYLNRVNDSE